MSAFLRSCLDFRILTPETGLAHKMQKARIASGLMTLAGMIGC